MFGHFFSPSAAGSDDFFAGVVSAYVEASKERAHSRLRGNAATALASDHQVQFDRNDVMAGWCPDMGYLNILLRQTDRSVAAAAVQYAVCAISSGASLDVTMAANPGTPLYFNGYRISTDETVSLRASNGVFSVQSGEVGSVFRLGELGWMKGGAAGVDEAIRCLPGRVRVLAGDYVDPVLRAPMDGVLSPELIPKAIDEVCASLATLNAIAPAYFAWCRRVVRQIQVIGTPRSDLSLSRSSPARPGAVVVSYVKDSLQCMEALVHECTHQYYYMASLLTQMRANPNDDTLYYSSIVDRYRPIDRVLLAYHATANIVLFLNIVARERSSLSDAAQGRMLRQGAVCKQLLDVLENNASKLSDNANEFWRNSREQVWDLLPRDGELSAQ